MTAVQRRLCLDALAKADSAIQSREKSLTDSVAHHLILEASRLVEVGKES